MAYRVGLPLWQLVGRMGGRLSLRVEIEKDSACNRYVATSPDLDGLVAEAATLDELVSEVGDCVQMILEEQLQQPPRAQAAVRFAVLPHAA
jgi:predicted RNase H-like HicB family nuclease